MCINLYEHIRFLDTRFRWQTKGSGPNTFFSDPLVFYRAAGSYFAVRNYRRCIHLLEEVLKNNYFQGFKCTERTSSFLNKKHFQRKLGEYYWRAYVTDKPKDHADLRSASKWLLKAVSSKEGPQSVEDFRWENLKAAALALTTFMFRYLTQEPPNWEEFGRNTTRVGRILGDERSRFVNEKTDADSLVLQGLAILGLANGDRVSAIKFAKRGLTCASQKQEKHGFASYVCQEVLRLIQVVNLPRPQRNIQSRAALL